MYGVGLTHAAADAGDQRRDRFCQKNVARVVVVAGDPRAFGDVDPADHGENRKGQRERQVVAHRDRHPFQES
jgi:hypothetical protein